MRAGCAGVRIVWIVRIVCKRSGEVESLKDVRTLHGGVFVLDIYLGSRYVYMCLCMYIYGYVNTIKSIWMTHRTRRLKVGST